MKKTTQAQAVRGFDTPEQASASARQAAAQAATRKAEDLSSQLDHLTEIVKLAAFAAEARRTLTAIYGIARFIPGMEETIKTYASPSNNWSGLKDNTGDVLVYVASGLEDVNTAFYGLVRLSASEAAQAETQEGGAA